MNLAGILMIREEPDLEGALRRIEDARRIYVEALGEGSAKVADADLALAMGLESLGRLEQAEQAYRRNLELQRRLKGERHPDLRHPLLALGTLLLDTGRPAEAIEPIEQAVALARELARSAGEGADPSGFIRAGERLLAQARAEAEP